VTLTITGTNRTLLAVIVCLASLFLVFLGVRNIALSSSPGPNQRPRAVIENTVKSAEEDTCKQQIDIEHRLPAGASPVCESFSSLFPRIQQSLPCFTTGSLSSRAPPPASSILS
jgi:hypothetical protein